PSLPQPLPQPLHQTRAEFRPQAPYPAKTRRQWLQKKAKTQESLRTTLDRHEEYTPKPKPLPLQLTYQRSQPFGSYVSTVDLKASADQTQNQNRPMRDRPNPRSYLEDSKTTIKPL